MTENNFNSLPNSADVSAFENADLSKLNATTVDTKPTEERLEHFLVRVVFFVKVFAWLGIITMILSGLY